MPDQTRDAVTTGYHRFVFILRGTWPDLNPEGVRRSVSRLAEVLVRGELTLGEGHSNVCSALV